MIVGIPELPLLEKHRVAFVRFFSALGLEPLVLPADRDPREWGTHLAHPESCLPMKLACGRAALLRQAGADLLFLPRFVRGGRGWCCPRSLGLPDTIRAALDLPARAVLRPELAPDRPVSPATLLRLALRWPGRLVSFPRALGQYRRGFACTRPPDRGAPAGRTAVALLGHSYVLDDPWASMDIVRELEERSISVFRQTGLLPVSRPPGIFWQTGDEILQFADELAHSDRIQGMIYVSPFPCGPDSILVGRVETLARQCGVPFLFLPVDEHSGRAAFLTRLEAFIDLLRYRKSSRSENRIPWQPEETPLRQGPGREGEAI